MKKIYLDDNLAEKIYSIIEQDVTTKYQFIEFQPTAMIFPKDSQGYYKVMGIPQGDHQGAILVLIPESLQEVDNVCRSFKLCEKYELHVEGTWGNELKYYVTSDTPILDETERKYLSFVFKPFAKRILSVTKVQEKNNGYQKLVVAFSDKTKMIMPRFEYNTIYRQMNLNVAYTLEDLDLFQNRKKITLSEFWESKEELVIHCDTEKKANKLLKAFHKLGKKWCDGSSYLGHNNWHGGTYKTCYSNNGCFSRPDFYKRGSYTIYEFEDVDLNK